MVALLDQEGLPLLEQREEAVFDDEHGHHDHDDGHDHGHGADGVDTHAWLDPETAALWMNQIAEVLAASNPENGALYRSNATQAAERLAAVTAQIKATHRSHKGRILVAHDSCQSFGNRIPVAISGGLERRKRVRNHGCTVARSARRHSKGGAR